MWQVQMLKCRCHLLNVDDLVGLKWLSQKSSSVSAFRVAFYLIIQYLVIA